MTYISTVPIVAATMQLGMFPFCKVYTLPHFFCFVDAYTIKANLFRDFTTTLVRSRAFVKVLWAYCVFCFSRKFLYTHFMMLSWWLALWWLFSAKFNFEFISNLKSCQRSIPVMCFILDYFSLLRKMFSVQRCRDIVPTCTHSVHF